MDRWDQYRWRENIDAHKIKRVNELPGYQAALDAFVQLIAEYVVEFMGPRWVDEVNARAKGELATRDLPLALSVKEAAKLTGISTSKIYEGVHSGQIPSLRLGSRISIPTHKLLELLETGKATTDN
jgi:excisionase family DNA binding protein